LNKIPFNTEIEKRRETMKKYGAEFFGTFWLVLGGCGSVSFYRQYGGVTGSMPDC
jgi:glycerol uptake facilitator-like aquaporin